MSAGARAGLDIGAPKVLGAVPGAAAAVLGRLAAALDGVMPSHIGIGIPGIVDGDRGTVSHAVNLGIGGDALPLAERLTARTGAVVVVENDVRAATWGAHVLTGADDLGYLSIGTGLAAGFVLRGGRGPGGHRASRGSREP